jgi:uncharacterized protein with HEPN domain
MTAERDDDLLVDMLIAARKALQFAADVKHDRFQSDEILQNAVIRMIQVIGEAANKLSEERRRSISAIPWEKMIGLRHRLVHDYFNINIPLIWQVLQDDLPTLIRTIEPLAPQEDA